jgi:hypothetical protein
MLNHILLKMSGFKPEPFGILVDRDDKNKPYRINIYI